MTLEHQQQQLNQQQTQQQQHQTVNSKQQQTAINAALFLAMMQILQPPRGIPSKSKGDLMKPTLVVSVLVACLWPTVIFSCWRHASSNHLIFHTLKTQSSPQGPLAPCLNLLCDLCCWLGDFLVVKFQRKLQSWS